MWVLGLDPGFAKFGWALARVNPGQGAIYLDSMGLIRTEKTPAKQKVLATDDNFLRTQEIVRALSPLFDKAQVVTAEGLSHARNASAMVKVGMAWGAVAALAESQGVPVAQATPQRIKKALTGKLSASKAEIQKALDDRLGYPLAEKHLPGLAAGHWEHPYDAVGSIVACLQSDVLRAAHRMVRKSPVRVIR